MGIFGTKIGKRSSLFSPALTAGGFNISSVRVRKIILDDITESELFKKYGEWNSIGIICYESVFSPPNPESTSYLNNIAYPLFSNIKNYPLENEIVFLLSLTSTNSQIITSNNIPYYISPINLWNSIHHNALPETVWKSLLPESQRKDYVSISTGNVRRVTDESTEINLGNTFVEKSNIKSLLPFEGDVIYEGRWGNSIRFSSTVKTKAPIVQPLNSWSEGNSNPGDPLIILRNGQYDDKKDPWVPIVEDINQDKSSIYITSTQKIPLKAAQTDYKSYTSDPPASPNQYSGHQIILNSGRLVFNSTSDHIVLSSAKTISFNAVKGFNFDTNSDFVINSRQIKLGNKDATEPLLLGNKTITLLQQILTSLQALTNVLPTVGTPIPFAPNVAVASAAASSSATLAHLIPQLESLKSKQNFTK